jgi:mono/diheme cytochrome c family protein
MALIIIITSATIVGVAYYLAYRNPVEFNLSHAVAVLLLALMATGAGEYSREMLRKPYVIGRWMYSNGVRVPYVARINQEGYLARSEWTWNQNQSQSGALPGELSSYSRGEAIFRGECGSCHTLSGYRPLDRLLTGRDRANIGNFIQMLHEDKADSPYHRFMPPMVGTKQDIVDLTDYLNAQVNPQAPKPLLTAKK